MKKQGLIEGTIISTAGSLATRTLGMFATIFICNRMGAEGVGVYQLMMTIYMLAYMVASAGIITAVSKLIAEEISRGWGRRAKQIMRTFFMIGIILSVSMTVILYVYAKPISIYMLRDSRSILGLKILAFSIPFMTISACFKGYFYAVNKVIKPASAEVFEQIIKLILIMVLLSAWADHGVGYGCAAIGLGMTLGEILSFAYLWILYLGDRTLNQDRRIQGIDTNSPLIAILKVLMPLALAAYIGGALTLLENILIPYGLKESGMDNNMALSTYGMIKGMVMPLIYFPTAFLSAGATILIPEIAKAKSLKWDKRVESLASRVIHFTMILAMFITSIFLVYGKEIGILIYHDTQVGHMLQVVVLMIPFLYLEIIMDGLLKGLGEQNSCLRYRIIDSVLRVGLMAWLIPIKGLPAFIAVSMLVSILTAGLMVARLVKVTQLRINRSKWIGYPVVSALAAALTSRVIVKYLYPTTLEFVTKIVGGIGMALIMYWLFLVLLESITQEDLALFRRKNRAR